MTGSADEDMELSELQRNFAGVLPPLGLLDETLEQGPGYSEETLEVLSRQVELKLKDLRIDAKVVGVYPGPAITRFELELAPDVRGSEVVAQEALLARQLRIPWARVVAFLPGKHTVGLDLPNARQQLVYLSGLLRSAAFDQRQSSLTLALGKDVVGRPVLLDLIEMPHLLMVGTTGSGKSVAVNAMVLSLLYKASPKDVRMIMIDPKMLELSVYECIPHLLAPVVTDMNEAANALCWCVAEMARRYRLMAAIGVRNLRDFNQKVKEAESVGRPLLDPLHHPGRLTPEPLEPLPRVVIVNDGGLDEHDTDPAGDLLERIMLLGSAAGIHLILTVQHVTPSLDGLFRNGVMHRLVFRLSTKGESTRVLGHAGAEALPLCGDMLHLLPGAAEPERVHGAFVDDHEVHNVVNWLKAQGGSQYIEGVLEEVQATSDGKFITDAGLQQEGGEADTQLYDKAVAIVTQTRRASISGVQRHLRIGYNRAARLIEQMEQDGVVSAPQHDGNREVLAPPPPRLTIGTRIASWFQARR